MFQSAVLDLAIGLTFCYASLAFAASSIYEAIASWMNLRGEHLLSGIKRLLNVSDTNNQHLLLSIYNHALSNPLSDGTADNLNAVNKPSYIGAEAFAGAFIDAIQSAPGNYHALADDIKQLDPQLQRLLGSMYERADGSIDTLHAKLAAWYDNGMDRVSGHYKRQSQVYCFLIALSICAVFNIDSIHLFTALWQKSSLTAFPTQQAELDKALAALHSQLPNAETAQQSFLAADKSIHGLLTQLPIGYAHFDATQNLSENLKQISQSDLHASSVCGWLITASTTLFGGPFWFDLLNRLVNLRGAGPKPAKSSGQQAENP